MRGVDTARGPALSAERSSEIVDLKRRAGLTPYHQRLKLESSGNGVFKALCPWHDDHDPSLKIYEADARHYCYTCEAHGDAIDLIQKVDGCGFNEAKRALEDSAGSAPANPVSAPKKTVGLGKIVETYPYTDEAGKLLFEVCRYEPKKGQKTFRQRRPDGNGGYIYDQ